MATSTMVHARVDKRVKAKAEKVLKSQGLRISDLVRVMLTRVARDSELPFDPFCDYPNMPHVPNAETAKALREAMAGKGMKSYASVKELMADLRADG